MGSSWQKKKQNKRYKEINCVSNYDFKIVHEERKMESFSIIMKKCIAFAILTAAIFLTSCSNTQNNMTQETSETESEKEDCAESTDSDDETSYCTDDETAAPGEDEIAAMREIVLEGVSENDAGEICSIIKTANHTIESAVIYDNFYSRLSDPDSLMWNYFDESGSIQIGWAYESDEYMQTKMSEESLTEAEFYEKYASKVITDNKYSAEEFAQTLEKYAAAIQNEAFKNDLLNISAFARMAAETHDIEYVESMYHILHDMDYYLLNYRSDTEGEYIRDKSTLYTYYGVLSVYN